MTELWQLSASALADLFKAGRASPLEALEAALSRIAETDDAISAFASLLTDTARVEARQRTDELAAGFTRGPLHGIPIAVKELFDVSGATADYGSDVLAGRIADTDAELVRRLRLSGAVVVGTTRSHEFGWGITTQHQRRGGTRNPWDMARVPGGSSGGSGAAVAAGMVPVAIGSDTGGSIRIPASFCGVVGLKPTFGRISRTGGVSLAPSLDTPGALGRTVEDVSTLVSAICGADATDPATSDRPFPIRAALTGSLHGVRLGHSPNLVEVELADDLAPVYDGAVDRLVELGAELVELTLPDAAEIRATFVPLQMAEAHHVHTRHLGLYPDRAGDYGDDVRSRLDAAAEVTIDAYLAAQEARQRVVAEFEHRLTTVDAIVSPVTSVAPSTLADSDHARWNGESRLLRDAVMGFTVPQNLTGLPVCIVSAGLDPDGLPVGIQVTAPRWRENVALAIGGALELTADRRSSPVDPHTRE